MTNGEPEFTVSMSAIVAAHLKRLAAEADRDGLRAAFRAALQTISDRLRKSPRTFGEELFDLPTIAVALPVVVEFGVYAERRLVFIRAFRYVPPS